MKIDPDSGKPIFLQIQEGLETAILTGVYTEESQVPSTTELSTSYNINPATALKGINILVDEDILYKKRGIGTFVKKGAAMKIKDKRKEAFIKDYILPLISEAKKLGISKEEINHIIKEVK